jgi:hypothetical protein
MFAIKGSENKIIELPNNGDITWTNPSIVYFKGEYFVFLKGVPYNRKSIWLLGDWDFANDEGNFTCPASICKLDKEFNLISQEEIKFDEVELRKPLDQLLGAMPGVHGQKSKFFISDSRVICDHESLILFGTLTVLIYMVDKNFKFVFLDTISRQFISRIYDNEVVNPAVFPSVVGSKAEKNWIILQTCEDNFAICTNINTKALLLFDYKSRSCRIADGVDAKSFSWSDGGWSGSTPFIPFDGLNLCILHRRSTKNPVCYAHMFVLCDECFNIKKASEPFSFEGYPIEFCCGLIRPDSGNSIFVSYSTWDSCAKIMDLPEDLIRGLLVKDIPSNASIADIEFDEETIQKNHFSDIIRCIQGRDATIVRLRRAIICSFKKDMDS